LAVLAVVLAGVGVSSAAAQQGRPEAQRRELGPEERRDLRRALRQGDAREQARRDRRARPEERAERERSRSAYRGLGVGEAQRVARERLGAGERRWRRPKGVVDRLDDRTAIVQRPDGERAVALSSVPLWTENASQERVPR
jgi:hypothetical protein